MLARFQQLSVQTLQFVSRVRQQGGEARGRVVHGAVVVVDEGQQQGQGLHAVVHRVPVVARAKQGERGGAVAVEFGRQFAQIAVVAERNHAQTLGDLFEQFKAAERGGAAARREDRRDESGLENRIQAGGWTVHARAPGRSARAKPASSVASASGASAAKLWPQSSTCASH